MPAPSGIQAPAPPGPEVHRVLTPPPQAPAEPDVRSLPLPRFVAIAPGQVAAVAASPAGWSFQTPRLLVEKRGPAVLQAGETALFVITVRNPGDERVSDLQIEEALPAQVTPLSAEPVAAFKDGRVRWQLPALGPREDSTVMLSLKATAPVQFGNTTSVGLSATGSSGGPAATPVSDVRPRPNAARLAVRVQGPRTVPLGAPAAFKITFVNQSAEPVRDLKLFGYLPEGLSHPAGPHLEADVEPLAAGASRTETMTVTAARQGRHAIAVKLMSATAGEAEAQVSVEVGGGGLVIHQVPDGRLRAGRVDTLQFEVTNQTERTLQQISVVFHLPDTFDFVDASNRGLYQANSRAVYWLVDLQPGNAQQVALKVLPRKAGQFPGEVIAQAAGLPDARGPVNVTVDGTPELSVNISETEKPLVVGKNTVYTIRLTNNGSEASTATQVKIAFPAGLTPVQADGPTQHAIAPREVIFAPLPYLPAQSEQIYSITAKGQREGEQRFSVQVGSDQVQAQVLREHVTQVEVPASRQAGSLWSPLAWITGKR
jgi:uncharacterized repeat protein (TIGR01451 family)